MLCLALTCALHASDGSAGIAWRTKGIWHTSGNNISLQDGDPVFPASLLTAGTDTGSHSITVLLPDGQRVLFECFSAADCSRGFRVPALTRIPEPFALRMLGRIRAVLAAERGRSDHSAPRNSALQASRDEAVAVIGQDHRVHLAGLVSELSPGQYSYDLRAIHQEYAPQYHQPIEKTSGGIDLMLPGPGLYILTIADSSHAPRVNLFFAAIAPAESGHFAPFAHARDTLEDWNGDYGGWPVDDFLRAYLESLSEDISTAPHRHVPHTPSSGPDSHSKRP